jgi:cell shape-determining protein MreC
LSCWRRQREKGSLAGLAPKQRGRKAKRKDPLTKEVDKLRRENQRLTERLRQAETIIDVQKKVSEMLGVPLKSPDDEGSE